MKFSNLSLATITVLACDTILPTDAFIQSSNLKSVGLQPQYRLEGKRYYGLTKVSSATETSSENLSPINDGDDEEFQMPILGSDGLYKIENEMQHKAFLEANPDKIVVLKFFAPWCRACKGLEPKFLAVSKDERYKELPLVFADLNVQNNRDYIKSLGILALPNVQIYAGSEGLVESFPCGPSKVPILKKKIAQVVNERVDEDTLMLKPRMQEFPDCDSESLREDEPCKQREINTSDGFQVSDEDFAYMHNEIPYFKDFDLDTMNELISKAKLVTYEPGSIILKQGMPGQRFYIIHSGEVDVCTRSKFDDPLTTPASYLGATIATMKVGDFFGERSLITGQPRAASVRALDKTRCYVFKQTDIPNTSVLSGAKSASKERLDQVNDKYGVDDMDDLIYGTQLSEMQVASQYRGSPNKPYPIAGVDNDEEISNALPWNTVPGEAEYLESTKTRQEIIELLYRFKTIRRAARCFEYIAKTQPRWGDAGEINRRRQLVNLLTDKQISDFRAAFEIIDKSRDNVVSLQEMRSFMESAGTSKTDTELLNMMQRASPENSNPQITYDEFLGVMAESEFLDLFNETFNALDKHNSGFVKAGDLDFVLEGMRDLISDDRKSIIDVEDMDMLINYEQFSKMLLGVTL